jgi:hypothetical protein
MITKDGKNASLLAMRIALKLKLMRIDRQLQVLSRNDGACARQRRQRMLRQFTSQH